MECAGRAQRRRRFGFRATTIAQNDVALGGGLIEVLALEGPYFTGMEGPGVDS